MAEQPESMEEILQSIRQIIANEEGTPAAPQPNGAPVAAAPAPAPASAPAAPAPEKAPAPAAPLQKAEDVLELTNMVPPEPPAQAASQPAPQPKPSIPAATNDPIDNLLQSPTSQNAANIVGSVTLDSILSNQTASISTQAVREMMSQVPRTKIDSPTVGNGLRLEDLVVDAMRPYLAEWLNKNLPTIVREIVTKEVRRIMPNE